MQNYSIRLSVEDRQLHKELPAPSVIWHTGFHCESRWRNKLPSFNYWLESVREIKAYDQKTEKKTPALELLAVPTLVAHQLKAHPRVSYLMDIV